MKQVYVTVTDRGPYSHADMDMSYGAFRKISSTDKGNVIICWRVV
jgi:rare lipoprotein A (peptidoglycan hydrolase)